ncbi:MAG TPA: MarC family protein [Burkholderiales bacterium]|jgi:MarC family membrane protein
MEISFASAVVILLLVTDPLGNIPLFVSLLRGVEEKRRARVIVRECLVALGVLLLFAIFGKTLLDLFGLSERSLSIAGGLILFLIALHMIFRSGQDIYGEKTSGDPFIVPLAIPAIAGPAAIATVILQVSRAPGRLIEWVAAVAIAMAVMLVTMLFAERISRWLGEHALVAFERLMGLLLTAIAVEMLLSGIEGFVRLMQSG